MNKKEPKNRSFLGRMITLSLKTSDFCHRHKNPPAFRQIFKSMQITYASLNNYKSK